MICDDDQELANRIVAALEAAGHEAEVCRHTMDALRAAEAGRFDLLALGLDMAGFSRAGALAALREVAPRVPLIALHTRPVEIMQAATQAGFAAVLPRTLAVRDFMYAVACALPAATPRAARKLQARRSARAGRRNPLT